MSVFLWVLVVVVFLTTPNTFNAQVFRKDLTVYPQGGYFKENEKVVLSCVVPLGEQLMISWFKNGEIILLNNDHVIMDNYGSLTITKFRSQDEGYYHCEAYGVTGIRQSPDVAVILFIPLSFVQHPVNATVRLGTLATFYCFANGSPKPVISWLKDSIYLTAGQSFGRLQVLDDGTLEIGNAHTADEGVYSCIATNNMGQHLMSNASLTVMYPPVIVNMTRNVTVIKHTDVTLQCEVKGFPRPTVTWVSKDVVQSRYSQMVTQDGVHSLSIASVKDSHEGKFICEAENKLGTARKELFLDVQGRTCRAHDEFRCSHGGVDSRPYCIPKVWVCDLDNDCSDNMDELNCVDLKACSSFFDFACTNGRCIPWRLTCDGDNDCGDNSDEHRGSCFHKCNSSIFFTCRNWKCVPKLWRCDGHDDCHDGSDEMGCTDVIASCRPDEFQCVQSNKCIKRAWVCDKEKDCSDGSDERDCEYAACGADASMFPCNNGACIPLPWKCDGAFDCTDRSDEIDCSENAPTQGEVSSTKCNKNDHLCDGVWCIHSSWLCDGERDCRDGSDERNCGSSPMSRSWCRQDQHECDEKCIPGNKICDGIDDCTDNSDEIICQEYILYSTQDSINKLDLQDYTSTTLISSLLNAVAIDIDIEEGKVYWTDIADDSINRNNIGRGNHSETVIQFNLESPEGIAVDWVGRKLYWTDRSPGKIEVAELDGRNRAVLISENIRAPRAVAVHPTYRLLFWTEWGEGAQIERCGMNGDIATRQVLVSTNIFWPNGLTISYQTERLWWVDAKMERIESMNFDGTDRRTEVEGGKSRKLGHPFSLAVFGEKIFWTDWRKKLIYQTTRKNPGARITVAKRVQGPFPMDIKIVHPHRQPKALNPCGLNNGQCSHLCLLSPNKDQQYSCFCPTGMKLWKDNKTCTIEDSSPYILFANSVGIFYADVDLQHISPVLAGIAGGAAAIDVDLKNKYLYWSNVVNDTIERVSLSHIGAVETIIKENLQLVDGIAYDWINRKLYWTDGRRRVIEVTDPEVANSRLTLIDEGLNKPRAIVLHPKTRYMYWTDWGVDAKIERCGMNGDLTTRETVVMGMFGFPNGLAIDYKEEKLWWADAMLDKIETSNLDGSLRRVVVEKESIHPFGLIVYNNSILWTDWVENNIFKADKLAGKIYFMKKVGSFRPTGIRVVHEQMYPKDTNPCGRKKKGCSHLCLLNPKTPYYSCRCPNGMKLLSDKRSCRYSQETERRSILAGARTFD